MKVKQLIEKLKTFNQDAVIVGRSDNFEKNGDVVDSFGCYEGTAEVENRGYRDAFDGESYSGKVYITSTNKKAIPIVNFYF